MTSPTTTMRREALENVHKAVLERLSGEWFVEEIMDTVRTGLMDEPEFTHDEFNNVVKNIITTLSDSINRLDPEEL